MIAEQKGLCYLIACQLTNANGIQSNSRFENYRDDMNRPRYAIAGFATVYPFFAYPENVRYRISQFLILPPFQRQGHGTRLLQTIYNNKPPKTVEICVEDPSDDFQKMRDRLDLRLFREYCKCEFPPFPHHSTVCVLEYNSNMFLSLLCLHVQRHSPI